MGETQRLEIPLGPEGHEVLVPVIRQPHGYLLQLIGRYMGRLEDLGVVSDIVDGASVTETVGLLLTAGDDVLYDIAADLIPDLPTRMSKHQWAGFRTEEDYKSGNYVRSEDHGPTVDQIEEAFKVAARINRLDIFKALWGPIKGMVGPKEKEELKIWIRTQFGSAWPSSPSTNTESNRDGSGETPPTSAPGELSPEAESGETTDNDSPELALAGVGSHQTT